MDVLLPFFFKLLYGYGLLISIKCTWIIEQPTLCSTTLCMNHAKKIEVKW